MMAKSKVGTCKTTRVPIYIYNCECFAPETYTHRFCPT